MRRGRPDYIQRTRDRLAAETDKEREARLQHDRERHREQQSQLPLFEQAAVQAKMRKFHAHLATLNVFTCLEGFPGLQLHSHSTECLRCSLDKHFHFRYIPLLQLSILPSHAHANLASFPAIPGQVNQNGVLTIRLRIHYRSSRSPSQCLAFH